MPSLMSLPREVRDMIGTYVICSRADAPSLEAVDDLLKQCQTFSNPKLRAWTSQSLIKYSPPPTYITTATPLLLVNDQVNVETRETLKRLGNETLTYDLDIIVWDEVILLPTWLRVPTLSTRIDTVNVTFRIAGFWKPKFAYGGGRYKGFRGGDGAGPAIAWEIYSILERFFKVGPTGKRQNEKEDRNISVRTLIIDVQTPPGISETRFGPPRSASPSTRHRDAESVLDPLYLAGFIIQEIHLLLEMNSHTAEYGAILYEHLDTIIVEQDGVGVSEHDIARQFDALYSDDWKREAREKRVTRGLKVSEESVSPSPEA